MLELTHINENNDNLYYDKLIGICIYIKRSIFKHFQENQIHLIRYHNILCGNVNFDTANKQIEVHNIEFNNIIYTALIFIILCYTLMYLFVFHSTRIKYNEIHCIVL